MSDMTSVDLLHLNSLDLDSLTYMLLRVPGHKSRTQLRTVIENNERNSGGHNCQKAKLVLIATGLNQVFFG